MNRREIEVTLRDAYARRAANDAEGASRIFGSEAVYRVSGLPEHCGAVTEHRGADIQTALVQVCEAFRASKLEITSMIIEDDRAAVRVQAHFRFTPTGRELSTELAHFWTFKDGKAVELVEFFDTAHVAHLLSG